MTNLNRICGGLVLVQTRTDPPTEGRSSNIWPRHLDI